MMSFRWKLFDCNLVLLLSATALIGCKLTSPLDEVDDGTTSNNGAPNNGGQSNGGQSNGSGNGEEDGGLDGNGDAGDGNTPGNGGAGGNGGSGTGGGGGNAAPCDVCEIAHFNCTVGAGNGQATVDATTSTGCIGVIGDANGTFPIWINCDTEEVCVDQEDACYSAALDTDGFSYDVTGGDTVSCNAAPDDPGPECEDIELLVDGDFDAASGAWFEASTNGLVMIRSGADLGTVTAHSGDWAAWLGGAADEASLVYQPVFVPVGTTQLTASGHLAVTFPDAADLAALELYSLDGSVFLGGFATWNGTEEIPPWSSFSQTLDATLVAGTDLNFTVGSSNDSVNNTNFFFDTLSLIATVCQ